MAITVRGTSTGTSNNATTTTISLPAGVAVGDVSIICYEQAANPGGPWPTMTPPAGWTALVNASSTLICWRAFQAGDATTGITATSTLANWWLSLCIAYSGLNTASPIDALISDYSYGANDTFAAPPQIARAPSLCPNFMGSQLLCIYAYNNSSGTAIALPAGLTAQVSTATGPNIRLCDKALTDGTPTGTFDAAITGQRGFMFFGAQIALKASGAAAATLATPRPQVVGSYNQNSSGGTIAVPLATLNVQNGDMVVVVTTASTGLTTPPSGYTAQSKQSGALIYTHPWLTGDTLAPVFTITGGAFYASAVSLVRIAGVSASPIAFDKITTATATGNPATTTLGTQTPSNATELLLTAFGSTTPQSGTWSGITGTGPVTEVVQSGGPGLRWAWVSPAGVPTGTYGATWNNTLSVTLGGAAMLLSLAGGGGGGATVQARAVVMA